MLLFMSPSHHKEALDIIVILERKYLDLHVTGNSENIF